MLDYIYGVSTVIKNENVMDLFILGDRFQIASLLHECKRYIIGKIDISTCLGIIKFDLEAHNLRQFNVFDISEKSQESISWLSSFLINFWG